MSTGNSHEVLWRNFMELLCELRQMVRRKHAGHHRATSSGCASLPAELRSLLWSCERIEPDLFKDKSISSIRLSTCYTTVAFTATPEAIFPLTWRHTFNILTYKSIAVCIERSIVLRANTTRVFAGIKQVKACMPCYSWLIKWCVAPSLMVKRSHKTLNSKGFY